MEGEAQVAFISPSLRRTKTISLIHVTGFEPQAHPSQGICMLEVAWLPDIRVRGCSWHSRRLCLNQDVRFRKNKVVLLRNQPSSLGKGETMIYSTQITTHPTKNFPDASTKHDVSRAPGNMQLGGKYC